MRMSPTPLTESWPNSAAAITVTKPVSRTLFSRVDAMARIVVRLLLVGIGSIACAADPPFGLVFRGGRIVDGSGNPWFVGDVAVRGDKIAVVGRAVTGPAKREVDARGLVIVPGFIDMHSHSDQLLLEDGNAPSKVRQGVTTEVLGEGSSAGPYA